MNKHINYFNTMLNNKQTLVIKKIKSDLIQEWDIKPKSKRKKFYKIYWVLRKNEHVFKDKNILKQGWNLSSLSTKFKKPYAYKKRINLKSLEFLNKPVFYKKNEIKIFDKVLLKGYTSYGDKIIKK